MFEYQKIGNPDLNPMTSLSYHWELIDNQGQRFAWKDFEMGPLVLRNEQIEQLCQKLLGIDLGELEGIADKVLTPVQAMDTKRPNIILHGTTPDLNTVIGDIEAVTNHRPPTNYAAYTETRSVYLAKSGALAVGRIKSWKVAATTEGIEAIDIGSIDYYYLSHALLILAESHLQSPQLPVHQILEFLQKHPNTIIRLYALEKEMQIFLIWLQRIAGLSELFMDANSPDVARTWNKKNILYPTIEDAEKLENEIAGYTAQQILTAETKYSLLFQKLGLQLPVFPGYTIKRTDTSLQGFKNQILQAAHFLRQRYSLQKGCLKGSASGDGARITPGIDLADEAQLIELATIAYQYEDDYVLEPNVEYLKVVVNSQSLKTTPSAHIRWGQQAPGATLQFTKDTSWKGNIFFDEMTAPIFGISKTHYQVIIQSIEKFLHAFRSRNLGLTIAGLDFAIGKIGGVFGDETVIGIQDPNISFNGAECLRVFMEKISQQYDLSEKEPLYAVTRVFLPSAKCSLPELKRITNKAVTKGIYYETIASVPGCWGMIAVAAHHPNEAFDNLFMLHDRLVEKGLIILK